MSHRTDYTDVPLVSAPDALGDLSDIVSLTSEALVVYTTDIGSLGVRAVLPGRWSNEAVTSLTTGNVVLLTHGRPL